MFHLDPGLDGKEPLVGRLLFPVHVVGCGGGEAPGALKAAAEGSGKHCGHGYAIKANNINIPSDGQMTAGSRLSREN